MWQASASFNTIKLRADITKQIRSFFELLDVIEVETPSVCKSTGTDAYLDAFKSSFDYDPSGKHTELYLQTSPEYAMKRLLCSGYGCIYQISKSFRNEPSGNHHNPEFTMLEWYRLGFDHHELMKEVNDLLVVVLGTSSFKKVTYQKIFIEHVKIDPLATDFTEVLKVIKRFDKFSEWHAHEDNLDMLLQFVFSEIIEPNIGKSEPWFVYDFPVSQASLARVSEVDSRVAHRFECYFQGLELANGFYELQNSEEQLARFMTDNEQRKELNKEPVTIDALFIDALRAGLPECSGVALGVDRLMMLALKKKSIKDVLTFTIDNA